MEGLPEESTSAEDYGALLATELEKSMFAGEPLLAICVDQSKACDTVRLDLLDPLDLSARWDPVGLEHLSNQLNLVGPWHQLDQSGLLVQ